MTDEFFDPGRQTPEEAVPQTTQPETTSAPDPEPRQPETAYPPYGAGQGSAPSGNWNYAPPSAERTPAGAGEKVKKRRTGVIVGVTLACVTNFVLLVAVILLAVFVMNHSLSGQSRLVAGESSTAEEKVSNTPIGTDEPRNGSGAIVNPDYTGDTMTPAQLYEQNVDSVVYVEATYSNGKSMGSGFVIDDENGYILTNHHVVNKATKVAITLVNGDSYEATVIGGDEINDIAVLKVEAKGLRKVTVGDSDSIVIGSYVNVIGNPLGELTFTITRGIIGAVGRSINTGEYNVNVFQTDAAINEGNSGGPAFDDQGRVIGIASAKYADVAVEGIGFCIPINDALRVAKDLVDYGYVKGRPNFGIAVSTSSGYATTTDAFGRRHLIETTPGAVVEEISENGCAAKAGVKVGDIITKLNDTKITTAADLINAKLTHKAGDTVTLEIFRDDELITVTVTLDEYQPSDK